MDTDTSKSYSIEKLRKRLLDLSARNRLLSYSHSRYSNSIRVVDELPDQLHEVLLSEEEFRFAPVPEPTRRELINAGYITIDETTEEEKYLKKEPTAEEWARLKGINTSYELPKPTLDQIDNEKYNDKLIQTLLFPHDLEHRLHNLYSRSRTYIEETGANVLFIAFGFLEWKEYKEVNNKNRIAPLLLIPVNLEKKLNRKKGIYDYTLSYTGEDILPNLSLREKLRIDFGLALPELDENSTPENYFYQVNNLIKENKSDWFLRRYVTIGLFNYKKLLMYLDLDLNNWPALKNHSVISSLCDGNNIIERLSIGSMEEYEVDKIKNVRQRYPLIYDADSSQHSALIDAINGKNLIIEGPPGTGKSQTITNLIASALHNGKSVLFVAEKLVALEVVKKRLDDAGLGEFCLELHSNKTQKRKVLKDIENRINKQGKYIKPSDLDFQIEKYEDLKDRLNNYLLNIDQKWKNTQLSIQSILVSATKYRLLTDIDAKTLHPLNHDGNTLTPRIQENINNLVDTFSKIHSVISDQCKNRGVINSHPWYGINNLNLQEFDRKDICAKLEDWQIAIKELGEESIEITEKLNFNINNTVTDYRKTLSNLETIPFDIDNSLLNALPKIRNYSLNSFETYLKSLANLKETKDSLSKHLKNIAFENNLFVNELETHYSGLKKLLHSKLQVNDLSDTIQSIGEFEKHIHKLDDFIKGNLVQIFGEAFCDNFKLNDNGIINLKHFVECINELKPSLWKQRDKCFEDEELDEYIPILERKISNLINQRKILSAIYNLSILPSLNELHFINLYINKRSFFRFLTKDWWNARKEIQKLKENNEISLEQLKENISSLITYISDLNEFENDIKYKSLLGNNFHGISTNIQSIKELRAWYKKVREIFGFRYGTKVDIGNILISMEYHDVQAIRAFQNQGLVQEIEDILINMEKLKEIISTKSVFENETIDLEQSYQNISSIKSRLLSTYNFLNVNLKNETFIDDFNQIIEMLKKFNKLSTFIKQENVSEEIFDGNLRLLDNKNNYDEKKYSEALNLLEIAKVIEKGINNESLKNSIYKNPNTDYFKKLVVYKEKLNKKLKAYDNRLSEFQKLCDVNIEQWLLNMNDNITTIIDRNEYAILHTNWLGNWLEYIRIKPTLVEYGLRNIFDLVEKGLISKGKVNICYQLGFYDLLSREIFKEKPLLSNYSKISIENVQQKFCECDKKIIELQKQKIAWGTAQSHIPLGVRGKKVGDFTDLELLRKECSKKKRHIPLRQLIKRANRALTALKPCFMMGPMSVAQYLEPDRFNFDIVIMDEASQIKPEDALGVIGRGEQVVIVGDSNQLPPTGFFERIGDEEEEEDISPLEEQESILDASRSIFDNRRLRWHYRSKHESLIAFSNSKFYDGDLIVFPSHINKSDEFGIKYHKVNGQFINKKNSIEAKQIAKAVVNHIRNNHHESVGVVAMNIQQKDLIESEIEYLIKEGDVVLRDRYNSNIESTYPLFFKNLESVQGDERDVIFISMTYGPREYGGRVFQRFGPINWEDGWRRLNVLFTRARKRIHVFTSMRSDDVIAENSTKGVIALKEYLVYAETGLLPFTEKETRNTTESDFEDAVITALMKAGYDCVPQYGVAGYRIDIAVKDPGNAGRFIMGIECDGATYHSAKSARDRDRLRQEILEQYGWVIRRIWSTDWYKNAEAEIGRILTELNKLKSIEPIESEYEPVLGNDDIEIIEDIENQKTILKKSNESLKEKLLSFNNNIIRKEMAEIPEKERILRKSLLDMFVEKKPTNKKEFLERIPLALRETITTEGKYLDRILSVIESTIE